MQYERGQQHEYYGIRKILDYIREFIFMLIKYQNIHKRDLQALNSNTRST